MITHDEKLAILQEYQGLLSDRASFDAHYKELSTYILPRRSRFMTTDTNKGDKRNGNIINSTATTANRILGAGMHAGITSPARPWFRTTVNVPSLADKASVKNYLHAVTQAMLAVMAKSNFYNGFAMIYQDLGCFGTAALWIDEDDEDVIRVYALPVGEYVLFTDHRNVVVGIIRKLGMTTRQIVTGFGLSNCSRAVKTAWEKKQYLQRFDVLHVVRPNQNQQTGKLDASGMAYESIWMEEVGDPEKPVLKESGYREFPVMAPRWSVTGMDVYGTSCPGMEALGDIKAMQSLEKSKGKIVALTATPPMKGSASLRNQRATLLPGDMTYLDGNGANSAVFEPSVKMDPNAVHVTGEEIKEHALRIREAFMADLWMMMASSDRREITAREVDERHEEKMLQLGPVLERLQDELLDPAIERIYGIMSRKGLLPPPPRELRNREFRVEYISILMQAQKLRSTSGIERLVTFAMNAGNANPEIMDNINWDKAIKHYGDVLGVKPDLLQPEDVVSQIRAARQQAAARKEQQDQLAAGAKAAQQLGRADTSGKNVLTDLMSIGPPAVEAAQSGMAPGVPT
jgi:hypothetical protein